MECDSCCDVAVGVALYLHGDFNLGASSDEWKDLGTRFNTLDPICEDCAEEVEDYDYYVNLIPYKE